MIQTLTDTTDLDREEARLRSECDIVFELIRKCVDENAHTTLNQSDYQRKYNELKARYDTVKKLLAEHGEKCLDLRARSEKIKAFISSFTECDGILVDFDESVWNSTVEKVVVKSDLKMVFIFRNGLEVKWEK